MVSAKFLASVLATLVLVSASTAQPNPLIEGAIGSVTNSRQVIDTLTHQLQTDPSHANADQMTAVITGLDSQIDNAIGTVSQALSPLTGGLSMAVGNFLLGPFVQSVTNGAEVLLSNIVGGGVDAMAAPVTAALSGNISKLTAQAAKYNVDTTKLVNLNKQLSESIPKLQTRNALVVRQIAFYDGVQSGMTNYQQTVDTLTHQLQTGSGHANADTLTAVITGLDSQIDNAIGTVSDALSPLTGGLSMAVGNFLLGPFVQSVTNGAEVMLSNIVGGGLDAITAPAAASLSGNISKLTSQASKYNVDTTKLVNLNTQLKQSIPSLSSRSTGASGPLEGAQGSMTNYRQVIDTLTRQLQTDPSHGAADVTTAVITGLDSQIDNAIGTVSEALAPLTGGASMAVGNFLLGPFVQSVTNGAEVVLSNLIGGGADAISAPVTAALSNQLSRLNSEATKYNIDTTQLTAVTQKIKKAKK